MSDLATLPRPALAPVLACGAYLKNRVCRIDGHRVDWSPEHGDLGDAAACIALAASIERLQRGGGTPVAAVAHDLHPDFESTRQAIALAARLGVRAIGVQHHHAHVAAVQAEHGIESPVIGIALDGVGLGTDGQAWGGELLWVDVGAAAHRWRRVAHLQPLAMPGGDVAAREPWRLAAALLHDLGRGAEIEPRLAPVAGREPARMVRTLLDRQLHCPPTSSAGRWFDAAAGALGLSVRQTAEAEAAMALEACASTWLREHPSADAPSDGLDLRPVVAECFEVDRADPAAVGRAAARFHLALAQGLASAAIAAAREHETSAIVLGGGCFLNRVLSDALAARLRQAGLRVHRPRSVACGDAGLALGQAWVAACAVTCRHQPAAAAADAVAPVH